MTCDVLEIAIDLKYHPKLCQVKCPEKAISGYFDASMEGPVAVGRCQKSLGRKKGAKYQGRKILRSKKNGLRSLRSIGIDGIDRVIGAFP